ncbi:MAG TPA: hypothetical protein VF995_10750 [Actinomycetota bacterium]
MVVVDLAEAVAPAVLAAAALLVWRVGRAANAAAALAHHAPVGPARQAEVAVLLLGTAATLGLAALLVRGQAASPLGRRRVELLDTLVNSC